MRAGLFCDPKYENGRRTERINFVSSFLGRARKKGGKRERKQGWKRGSWGEGKIWDVQEKRRTSRRGNPRGFITKPSPNTLRCFLCYIVPSLEPGFAASTWLWGHEWWGQNTKDPEQASQVIPHIGHSPFSLSSLIKISILKSCCYGRFCLRKVNELFCFLSYGIFCSFCATFWYFRSVPSGYGKTRPKMSEKCPETRRSPMMTLWQLNCHFPTIELSHFLPTAFIFGTNRESWLCPEFGLHSKKMGMDGAADLCLDGSMDFAIFPFSSYPV